MVGLITLGSIGMWFTTPHSFGVHLDFAVLTYCVVSSIAIYILMGGGKLISQI